MSRRQFVTLMAACLTAGALAAGGAVAFAGETARVEVGAGASVTLGLNRWSRVVRATASQPALQDQIDSLALAGLGCEDAVARLSSDDALCQALSDEETLVIAVTSDNASQQQSVLGMCRNATQGGGTRSMCMASDEQTVAAARQAGMGVARYEVYEQIAELDPDVTLEQCQGMRMRQLRALLAEKQAEAAGTGSDDNTASSANAGSDSSDSAAADAAASSVRDASAKSEARGRGMMGAGHGGKGGGPGMGMGHGGRGMGSGMGRHADAAE